MRARTGDSRIAVDRGDGGGNKRESKRYTGRVIRGKRLIDSVEDEKGRIGILKAGIGMSDFVRNHMGMTFLTSTTGAIQCTIFKKPINKHISMKWNHNLT